jgi:hypothetical protein
VRTLGFGAVTVALVTWLHLARAGDHLAAEAVDGVVSGLVFTLCFAAGDFARRRFARVPGGGWLAGAIAGVLAWTTLWLFWAWPATTPLRAWPGLVFAINCTVMVGAGLLRGPAPRRTATA